MSLRDLPAQPGAKGRIKTLVLALIVFVAYKLNGRPQLVGDAFPATLIPIEVLRGDGPFLDRYQPLLFKMERGRPYYAASSHGHLVSCYPPGGLVAYLPFFWPPKRLMDLCGPGWDSNPRVTLIPALYMAKDAAALIVALTVALLHRLLLQLGLAIRTTSLYQSRFGVEPLDGRQPGRLAARAGGPCTGGRVLLALISENVTGGRLLVAGFWAALLVTIRPIDLPFHIPNRVVGAPPSSPGKWPASVPFPILLGSLFLAHNLYFFGSMIGGQVQLDAFNMVRHNVTGSWSRDFLAGLAGTLLSPSRGLFVFCPWAALAVLTLPAWSARLSARSVTTWVLGALVVFGLLISSYSVWWAGQCSRLPPPDRGEPATRHHAGPESRVGPGSSTVSAPGVRTRGLLVGRCSSDRSGHPSRPHGRPNLLTLTSSPMAPWELETNARSPCPVGLLPAAGLTHLICDSTPGNKAQPTLRPPVKRLSISEVSPLLAWPKATQGLAELVSVSGSRATWILFLVSVLGLYLELALIRWIGTEIRIFAYLQNTILVVCFMGLGMGCLTCRKPVALSDLLIPLFVLMLLLAVPLTRTMLGGTTAMLSVLGDLLIWKPSAATSPMRALIAVALGLSLAFLLMVFVCDIFIPIGRLMGRIMDDHPRTIWAYSVNVAGGLIGIWLFVLISALGQPPVIWLGVAAAALDRPDRGPRDRDAAKARCGPDRGYCRSRLVRESRAGCLGRSLVSLSEAGPPREGPQLPAAGRRVTSDGQQHELPGDD